MIICLSSCGHYPNEYRKVTSLEYKKLIQLKKKYGYLDAAPNKEYLIVQTILNRKEIEIPTITKYC